MIDWNEPARNAHILDWRGRAHEFGLVPLDPADGADTDAVVDIGSADRLLQEEEPEAAEPQAVDQFGDDESAREEAEMAGSADDVDPVRVYLNQIGRRKLLKARDEQEIGSRIERARGDLLAALGSIPAARQTLLALADAVRQGSAPAAELILLPDGGELKPESIEPVLRAMTRVRSHRVAHRASGGAATAKTSDRRPRRAPRFRQEIARAEELDRHPAARPADPSVRRRGHRHRARRLEHEFERCARHRAGRERARRARHELESRTGLPRARVS